MSYPKEIVRIAARGDGVTADAEHVSGAVTGDLLREDGSIEHGPHHQSPPCPHFVPCGACQLQHADEAALEQFVRERVAFAAESQSLAAGELLPTHLSPPRSRRRATLHGLRTAKGAVLGFREASSNRVVDLRECHVLQPQLIELVAPLRKLVAEHGSRGSVDIGLASVDQGVDCSIRNFAMEGLEATEAVLDFARDHGLARVAVDMGFGAEAVWEPEPVTVTLSGVPVSYPAGAFLQATPDAEALMAADAAAWLDGTASVADLFAGLGTFALALSEAREVIAFEAARDAHLACLSAARRTGRKLDAKHRDLFRNPLQPDELSQFDAVVLDPPRAGAKEQVAAIAQSKLERVVYVSCNPSSWARDAAQLAAAGFKLEKLRPVGQFRWSTHVELTSLFVR
ncbi:class I SAM-dependent RNA methyltransferase [Altererythrobacter lutimaris]|uniref:Class I SAM-dependent RNA methyltransferase n=1 Tax=Altererythrobacter lutimaris TaxID=2743979 RepID=A0A850HBI4_9SPHN|nr:class I SAM-dependent RNA methyltransferase [Altererythrobacter lutimaris]NVE93918.1 class I SAM-dependent RNA methyltransferase [Altererythrobacter lutimaris]